jgi:hypothetical protein
MKIKTAEQLMTDNTIVKHYSGSHAYGMALPTSDVDFRGIFVADPVNLLTPFYKIEESVDVSEEDTKLFELSQFMKLLLNQNPNIVESLWVRECDVIVDTPAYQYLRSHRERLLSSKVAFTYSGYALAQLKRIKGHNKWITNPQDVDPPKQIDFMTLVHNFTNKKMFKIHLPDIRDGYRLVPYEKNIFGVYEAPGYQTFSDRGTLNTVFDNNEDFFTVKRFGFTKRRMPLFIVKFNASVYEEANVKWKQYWEWKNNRNEKRSVLEEQFGYDTKHASHLVRLLKTGAEILETGQVQVFRPDAAELLEIRNGKWKYEELVQYAEHMDNHIRDVLYKTTSLPKTADIKFAAEVIMEIQQLMWNK